MGPADSKSTSGANADALWRTLERHASRVAWLAAEVSDIIPGASALVFSRHVSRPMRAILRAQAEAGEGGAAYVEIHRRAIAFWRDYMSEQELERAAWLMCARLSLFHALELFEPEDRVAREIWTHFADAYAGDGELLAELAREVLDGSARRAEWQGPPVDSALLLAAYLALAGAEAAVDAVASARHVADAMRVLAENERALELSDAREFSLVRGLSYAASGQNKRARKLLEATLWFPRADTHADQFFEDQGSAKHAAVEVMAHRALADLLAAEEPDESFRHMRDAWQLARDRVPLLAAVTRHELWRRIMQREYYHLVEPENALEQVSYNLALGRAYRAVAVLHEMPHSHELERLRAWLHIELCQPLEAGAAVGLTDARERGHRGPLFSAEDIDGQSIWALVRAQLCDLEQALLYADQVARARAGSRTAWQLGVAIARACIEHQALDPAERLLRALGDDAPSRNLAVSRDSVLALSLAERGDSHGLERGRALFRRTEDALPENARLTPSVRVYRALVRARLFGDMNEAFSEVCAALEEVRSGSRRLRIMDGLRSLDVRPALDQALGRRLCALIEPGLAEYGANDDIRQRVRELEPMQSVRWAAVLRAVGERDTAERVLCDVLGTCGAPVGRMAWRELDRLGSLPLAAAPVTLHRYQGEPLFRGVVCLEHAERLAAIDRAHPEVPDLLEQCMDNLPMSAGLPFYRRIHAIRELVDGSGVGIRPPPLASLIAPRPRAPVMTVAFASPSMWHVRTAHGHERTFLHSPALTRPAADAWVADEYWRALPSEWRAIAAQLGEALYEWLDADTRDLPPRGLVRVATLEPHADFVPWGLAHREGAPLAPELVVVRSPADEFAASARVEDRVHAALVVVHGDDQRLAGAGDALPGSWLAGYRAAGFEPRVLTPGQAVFGLARAVSGPVVLHLTGALHMYRGRVLLRLEAHVPVPGEPLAVVDAQQLARALARAPSALVILAARTPSASTERARQLVLRDFFASELTRAHPGVSVLGTGLARSADRGAMMAAIMEHLAHGQSAVYDLVRRLARCAVSDHFQASPDSGLIGPTTRDTLVAYARDIGLADRRARLLCNMHQGAMRELPTAARDPEAQLASDIENLVRLANAGLPDGLAVWLENALAVPVPASVAEAQTQAAHALMRSVATSLPASSAPAAGSKQPVSTLCAFERVLPFAGASLFSRQPERVFTVGEGRS